MRDASPLSAAIALDSGITSAVPAAAAVATNSRRESRKSLRFMAHLAGWRTQYVAATAGRELFSLAKLQGDAGYAGQEIEPQMGQAGCVSRNQPQAGRPAGPLGSLTCSARVLLAPQSAPC